jgi:hypothetical protein
VPKEKGTRVVVVLPMETDAMLAHRVRPFA